MQTIQIRWVTLLLIVVFLVIIIPAYAICNPNDVGTAGNDTIDCTMVNAPVGDVEGLGGDDTITIQAGVTSPGITSGDSAGVLPGNGNDIIINNGTASNGISGDSFNGAGTGNDIIINNGTSNTAITGDSDNGISSGDDYIENNGVANDGITGDTITNTGSGDDIIVNNNAITSGVLTGDSDIGNGSGNDTIINNGTAAGGVTGDTLNGTGSGNDTITSSGTVNISVSGDSNFGDGTGNDSITNNGNVEINIYGDTDLGAVGAGDDVITNNGNVGEAILGDAGTGTGTGNDSITNNGTVGTNIYGDSALGASTGSDTITNSGTVNNSIYGDNASGTGTGNDNITNSGTVNNDIVAGGGNDTVTIQGSNAEVGGVIDGGANTDTLVFDLSSNDPEEIRVAAEALAAANPAGGTLVFNGHTYTWQNFEELVFILTLISRPRLNEITAPIAIFCAAAGGIDIYAITSAGTGVFALWADPAQIRAGLDQAATQGQNVVIASGGGATLWALSSGEVQANASDGYDFTFGYEQSCDSLPAQGELPAAAVVEEIPPLTIINREYDGQR